MADDRAFDDLPRGFRRAVLAAAIAIAGVAITAAVTIEKPFLLLFEVLFPYPFTALVGAGLTAWIAARLRHAPARSRVGRLVPWSWVIVRLAFMAATFCLMAAWAVAAAIGASVAATLVQAFLVAFVAKVIFMIAEQCAIDVRRAIRGPVSAGS